MVRIEQSVIGEKYGGEVVRNFDAVVGEAVGARRIERPRQRAGRTYMEVSA